VIERVAASALERVAAPALEPGGSARHVAIIMDGNRRWAKSRGLAPSDGHRAGADALVEIVRAARGAGIEFLTAFAFSEENWRREPDEVGSLMELLQVFSAREAATLCAQDVRVRPIGRIAELPEAPRRALEALESATAGNAGLTLSLAVNYGARTELCDAIRALARDVAAGKLDAGSIDGGLLGRYLYTAGLPDPDLLIRTGGELRVSNFLLYQIAYAELWSTPVCWPDFSESLLHEALGAFSSRQRRFGT
jgi:undecaprenyl diphosphate synthase